MKIEPGQKTSRFGEKGMRLVRSWETLLLLVESSSPLTAHEIHEKIHRNHPFCDHPCGIQTTREDLKTLQKCGFPVCMIDDQSKEINSDEMESCKGRLKNVRWQIRDQRKLGELENSYHRFPATIDLVTLSLSRALLKDVVPRQYPLYRSLSKMLDELQLQTNRALRVGDTGIVDLHGKVRVLGRRFVGKSVSSESWEMMTTAIARRQVLIAMYENRAVEKQQVDIAPLAVWFSEGRAYLLAAGAMDEKIRTWRMDRFSDVKVAAGRGAPKIPDDVIENTLKNGFKGFISEASTICLKVRPDGAYLFREFQYHPSQKIVELFDGSIEVSIECAMGWGMEEWILGFGELVVVKGPEVLRARIIDRLRAGLKGYF
ncbi:MAG: WYL domain-containing protein [Legionella sp.]|uniref:helix-turn-helix transcriptional regulator n=1 Tax=Legionella sp. TaxID=459 RepID=UPI00283E0A4E|nr:WYL domain-containing protein [Legionella sp.]